MKILILRDMSETDESLISKVKLEWHKYVRTAQPPSPAASRETLTFTFESLHGPWEEIRLNCSNVIDLSRLWSLDMGNKQHKSPRDPNSWAATKVIEV
ncbi:hypothetical protein EYZ11_003626 [Aspergillus tanneri]|uniref:Uncharacterized protein n=1 Tax=Aspergillus tanneri TaxID=1220188 RepID=A0A4S3JMP1_9EURO|nr:hypothetical protein EYZ11_003626 [Aspergillus tanneri]